MRAPELSIQEREDRVSIEAAALDAMASEWLAARKSGDTARVTAAGPALNEALARYRWACRKLDKALKRLAHRAEKYGPVSSDLGGEG